VIYVFGDNDEREGLGGQAGEARGEPNAIGVRTKWKPDMRPASFFSDLNYVVATRMISNDLAAVTAALDSGKIVVFPEDGLGTGLSELPKRAPRINAFLEGAIGILKTKYASRTYTAAEVGALLRGDKLAGDSDPAG